MSFPYVGNFLYFPCDDLVSYAKSVGYENFNKSCSAIEFHSNPERGESENVLQKYYNWHNNEIASIPLETVSWWGEPWFNDTGLDINKKWTAKIYWTKPGTFEPPHIDFYPSFLGGQHKPDGSLWTKEDIVEIGEKIQRLWVPLQSSKLGHLFYTEDYALSCWNKGDVYRIPAGMRHGFVNGGVEDRFLLVITGYIKKGT
jgi:hypothetical protein